ncbi:MAG TPA: S16 family serine protease [Candidatus Nanoarchaeia archaeon]|nr:S16 family serine protease [Candidatus Nanoarchaeia archaeon]
MVKKMLWLVLLLCLCAAHVLAQSTPYHLKLLAVQETDDGYKGSGADLYLELKEGSGRVFLETTPVTKMDTQISTRFAKEIACNHFKLDCNTYDFIFTIKSESNIIGGPSAGAAVAALTAIAVLNLEYRDDIAITGTINSGGIVGPVGGTKQKIEAASEASLQKVLIASGSANFTEENESINLITYGKELNVDVVEIVDLDDVLYHLTGVDLNHQTIEIKEDENYRKIMGNLKDVLCQRTEKIESEMTERGIRLSAEVREAIKNRKHDAQNATSRGDYYSAASFCFGSNLQLKSYYYEQEELSASQIVSLVAAVQHKVATLEQELVQEDINTIADLQTLIIVQERIHDVKEQLSKLNETDTDEEKWPLIAYAEERFFSAISWTQFFSMDGKHFVMNQQQLHASCQLKIAEAEERYQYTSLFLQESHLAAVLEKINIAKESQARNESELCLIEAAQAKADSNAILSSLGLDEGNVAPYLESKQKAVKRVIAENSAEDIFPILGYSYYQYANSLKETEPFTSLVYFEYALEMSDLGMYFPEEETFMEKNYLLQFRKEWGYGGIGIIVGLIAGILIKLTIPKCKRKKKKKKN